MRYESIVLGFNDLIRDLEIQDIPLNNRAFTWSNKRPDPVFSKLDRFFLSTHWSLCYPKIELQALEMVVSDHVPLLLSCKKNATTPCPIRMETFWFDYEEVGTRIQEIWANSSPQSNSLFLFYDNISRLHSVLRSWHQERFGKTSHQLELCHNAILHLDQLEETSSWVHCVPKSLLPLGCIDRKSVV